jgi:uncharacterized RDD family membrane protein YckC
MADDKWYYTSQGQRTGPVTQQQIRELYESGEIEDADLVWTAGMKDWMPAAQARERIMDSDATMSTPATTAGLMEANVDMSAGPMGDTAGAGLYDAPPADEGGVGLFDYAGFWLRVAAYVIDSIILNVGFFAMGCLMSMLGMAAVLPTMPAATGYGGYGYGYGGPELSNASSTAMGIIMVIFYAATLIIPWLYFALMESSSRQATLGKMAVRLQVTDVDGNRLSFLRASGRFFGKILSAIPCSIGFIMAGFTEKKQALHDILAGTLVVRMM